MTPEHLSRQVKSSYGVSATGSYSNSKPTKTSSSTTKHSSILQKQQYPTTYKTATLDLSSTLNNTNHLQNSYNYKHIGKQGKKTSSITVMPSS